MCVTYLYCLFQAGLSRRSFVLIQVSLLLFTVVANLQCIVVYLAKKNVKCQAFLDVCMFLRIYKEITVECYCLFVGPSRNRKNTNYPWTSQCCSPFCSCKNADQVTVFNFFL
jgi:hypothetical protein